MTKFTSTPLRTRLFAAVSALLIALTLCAVTTEVSPPSVASAQAYGDCSYLGSNYYWNGATCVYTATPTTTCATLGTNYYWNGSTCVYTTVTTTVNNCSYLGANYYWNGSTCVFNPSGTTTSCSYLGPNYYWNGSTCVYSPTGLTTTSCSYLGPNYYWNGSTCVYSATGTTTSCSYLGPNYYWNGSTCVFNPSGTTTTSCAYLGANYYWNGTTCVYSPTTITSPFASTVTYQVGWNIVGGPTGTTLTGSTSPLYAYPPGANGYQTLPPGTPLQAGQGYWAYFNTPVTVSLAATTTNSVSVTLPPAQWVLIGNPGTGTATVTGSFVSLFTYDPVAGAYAQATTIPAGQGAWAFAPSGGTVTITSSAAGGPPPPP